MIQVKRNSARLAASAALLFFGCVLAGCETAPPDGTDEPPIGDAAPEPAALIVHTAVLHPTAKKAPRLLNAAVEVHDLHAPASEALPAIIPRPRQPDRADPPPSARTASVSPQAPLRSAGDKPFEWPVEGKILSGFGSDGDGERNDGINIAAAPGTPIHAAAAGAVTYAARLKGYGNLVLIRHENGYITAYAHAQSLLVATGDRVARGDVIGLSGKTGTVSSPQLHFEIREGTKPVDPRPLMLSSRES